MPTFIPDLHNVMPNNKLAGQSHTMPTLQINSREELSRHHLEVLTAARKTSANLQRLLTQHHGIDLLHELRFMLTAFSPFNSDKLYNIVEAINQSFTSLVSFAGAELIVQCHLDDSKNALPLQLNVGPVAGYDIQNSDGSIIAECFAAVTPDNNNKLANDFRRLQGTDAEYKYLFFYSPTTDFRDPPQDDTIHVVQLTLDQLYGPSVG